MVNLMKTITCDVPECKSYYQAHPTAQNIEHELRQRGWKTVEVDGKPKHCCPTHIEVVPDSVLKRVSGVPV